MFLSWTNLVKEIWAADSSDLANVVHEAQVSFSGAVDLTHADLPKAPEELSPYVLPEAIPDAHAHPVILLITCLINTHTHTDTHYEESFHNPGYLQDF